MSKRSSPTTYLVCGTLMLLMVGIFVGFIGSLLIQEGSVVKMGLLSIIFIPVHILFTFVGVHYIQMSVPEEWDRVLSKYD